MYKNDYKSINDKNEDFFNTIFQNMPLPVVAIDMKKQEIFFGNKLFHKLFSDLRDEEMLLSQLIHEDETHIPIIWLQKSNGYSFPCELFIQKISVEDSIFLIIQILDITKRKISEETLQNHATKDHMTDLFNRRVGLEILERECKQAILGKDNLTIGFVDIDGLKQVNDVFGHTAGDNLIKAVADLIKQFIEEEDIACRLGGDEFLIIFKDCNKRNAQDVFAKIKEEADKLNQLNLNPYDISISHGLAEFSEIPEKSVNDFINIADKRMYHEKQKSKEKKRFVV